MALFMVCIMVLPIVAVPKVNVYATTRELVTIRAGEIFEIRNTANDNRQGHNVTLSGSRNVYFDFIVYTSNGNVYNAGLRLGRGMTLEHIIINGRQSTTTTVNATQFIPRGGKMLIEVRGNGHVAVSGDASIFAVEQLQTPVFYVRILNQNSSVSLTNSNPANIAGDSPVRWIAYGHPFPPHLRVDRPNHASNPFRRQVEFITATGQRRSSQVGSAGVGTAVRSTETISVSNQSTGNRPAWAVQAMEIYGDYAVFSGQPYRLTTDGQRSFPPGRVQDLPPRQRNIPAEYYALYRMLKASNYDLLFGRYTAFTEVWLQQVRLRDVFLLGLTSDVRSALVRGLVTGNLDSTTNAIMNNPQRVQAIVRDLVNGMVENTIYTANKDVAATFNALSSLASVLDANPIKYLLDTLKITDGGIEVLSRTAQEYSQNIAILQSIRGLNSSRVFQDTVDAIILEYQRSVGQSLLVYAEYLIQGKLINEVIRLIAGKPTVAITSVLDAIVRSVATVTDLETMIVTDNMNVSLIDAFRNSADVIVSGNFTSADVEAYRNAFYMARGMQIMRYEAKRSQFDSGSRGRNHINAQLRRLREMTHDRFVYSVPF